MKKLLLTIALTVGSLSGYAYNPTLTPAMNNVESCLASDKVLLCNGENHIKVFNGIEKYEEYEKKLVNSMK